MKFFVLSQVTWSPKFLITDDTNIIFNSMMNRLDMNFQISWSAQVFATDITPKFLGSSMNVFHMRKYFCLCLETFVTFCTL